MDKDTEVRANFQTYMIVWDVNLQTTPYEEICIFSPDIRLSKNECLPDKISILIHKSFPSRMDFQSYYHTGVQPILHGSTASIEFRSERNRSSEEFQCNIHLLDLSRKTIKRTFMGLGTHKLDYNGEWTRKCCYVFELKLKCAQLNVKPTIWLRGSTKTIPLIVKERRTNAELLCLLKFMSKKNNPCKMLGHDSTINFLEQKYEKHFYQSVVNLSMLCDENVISNMEYLLDVVPFDEMNEYDITELSKIIPQITDAENHKNLKDLPNAQTISAIDVIPQTISNADLNPSSYLYEYYIDKKLCDVTVRVEDQHIRAHKVALANGSKVWADLFFANETLTSVQVVDFEYRTIKNLVEYIYTGIVKQDTVNHELLLASEKYEVFGLKKQCETFLCETIEMKTSANLLVLAHQCNATSLFAKVVTYIGKNRSEFRKLDEAKSIFMTYPELAFELFANI